MCSWLASSTPLTPSALTGGPSGLRIGGQGLCSSGPACRWGPARPHGPGPRPPAAPRTTHAGLPVLRVTDHSTARAWAKCHAALKTFRAPRPCTRSILRVGLHTRTPTRRSPRPTSRGPDKRADHMAPRLTDRQPWLHLQVQPSLLLARDGPPGEPVAPEPGWDCLAELSGLSRSQALARSVTRDWWLAPAGAAAVPLASPCPGPPRAQQAPRTALPAVAAGEALGSGRAPGLCTAAGTWLPTWPGAPGTGRSGGAAPLSRAALNPSARSRRTLYPALRPRPGAIPAPDATGVQGGRGRRKNRESPGSAPGPALARPPSRRPWLRGLSPRSPSLPVPSEQRAGPQPPWVSASRAHKRGRGLTSACGTHRRPRSGGRALRICP